MSKTISPISTFSRRQFLAGSALALGAASTLALGVHGAYGAESSAADNADATQATGEYPVTVVDRLDREVQIDKADNIVTLCATGFDRMLVLGQADRVVGNFGSLSEWAIYANGGQDVNSLGGGNVAGDPDVESLNALETDVLYCWQEAIEAGNVTDPDQANFAAVCAQLSTGNPTTVDEFRDYLTSEIDLYADAMVDDPSVAERAQAWKDYANEKLDDIAARVADLADEDKPTVYFARGGKDGADPYNAFLKSSYPDFLVQIAGGVNVADDADGESYGDVTAEQIAVWNPQYIFAGRIDSTDPILDDDAFAETDAVKNGNVFLSPNGVMQWDTGSECVLYALYIAKTLHADLFEDIDIAEEIKTYYATFYDTELTDDQAQAILNRQGPGTQEDGAADSASEAA